MVNLMSMTKSAIFTLKQRMANLFTLQVTQKHALLKVARKSSKFSAL